MTILSTRVLWWPGCQGKARVNFSVPKQWKLLKNLQVSLGALMSFVCEGSQTVLNSHCTVMSGCFNCIAHGHLKESLNRAYCIDFDWFWLNVIICSLLYWPVWKKEASITVLYSPCLSRNSHRFCWGILCIFREHLKEQLKTSPGQWRELLAGWNAPGTE